MKNDGKQNITASAGSQPREGRSMADRIRTLIDIYQELRKASEVRRETGQAFPMRNMLDGSRDGCAMNAYFDGSMNGREIFCTLDVTQGYAKGRRNYDSILSVVLDGNDAEKLCIKISDVSESSLKFETKDPEGSALYKMVEMYFKPKAKV